MTEQLTIPPKPTDTSPAGWLAWVQRNYALDRRFAHWLRTRKQAPRFGTAESLEDLRGVADRHQCAQFAEYWWTTHDNQERIEKEHALAKHAARQVERKRLILLAKRALDGKLGEGAESRDDARATAQTYLRNTPENSTDDELGDWMEMHQYAKRRANGWNGPRPELSADRRKAEARKRDLDDIDAAIDGRYEQGRMF